MPSPTNALHEQLHQAALKLATQAERALSAHGLSYSEYRIMARLAASEEPAIRRIDLAEQVQMSPSGITRLLNPLERRGLIKKETLERDARASLVRLSKSGNRLYKEASLSYQVACDQLFDQLDEKEQKRLSKLISRL